MKSVKAHVSSLKRASRELTISDEETAEVLVNNFQKMFTKEPEMDQMSQSQAKAPDFRSDSTELDVESVIKKLSQLAMDKSAGPDGIHPAILKNCTKTLAEPISMIFCKSFKSGKMTAEWKTAHKFKYTKKVLSLTWSITGLFH